MAQIPFTRGVPSADLLPVDDLRAAVDSALTREPALALAYLGGAGHPGLRSWIGERHGVPAAPGAGRVLVLCAMSVALASLSWTFFEKPINQRRPADQPAPAGLRSGVPSVAH